MSSRPWQAEVYAALKAARITQLGYVSDAGHAHLIEAAQRPNVELRVLPLSAGERAVISGSFVLMHFRLPSDSHLVFVESLMSAFTATSPEAVERLDAFLKKKAERLNVPPRADGPSQG